jgi:hypothetical protein
LRSECTHSTIVIADQTTKTTIGHHAVRQMNKQAAGSSNDTDT